MIGLAAVLLATTLAVTVSMSAQADPRSKTLEDLANQTGEAPIIYPKEPLARTIGIRSLIPDVDVTGFVIFSDQQVKVTVRYTGAQKAPPITVVVVTEWTPLPTPYLVEPRPAPPEAVIQDAKDGYYPHPYPSFIGSTVVTGDWSPTIEVKLGVVGKGTVYDFTSIQILILPYTGSA